ncbi:MAG: helix-turn-helix domain-containing protein [Candidatus Izemoplasmatales bacterium]
MIEAIADLIAKGNYMETACRTMGVSRETVYNWLEQGRADVAAGKSEDESLFITFLDAINKADAQAEVALVELAKAKATRDMTSIGAFTFLDRRWRDRWGQHATVDVNEHKSVTITHVEVCLPPGTRQPSIDTTVTEVPMIGPATDSNAKFSDVSGDES